MKQVVMESLEGRQMLSGWAPESIAGWVLSAVIHDGSSPFADSGSYQVHLSKTGNTYQLIGGPGIANSSGTYIYTRTGDHTATFVFKDSFTGIGASQTLTFHSDTTASYYLIGNGGYQTGVFTVLSRPQLLGRITGTVFNDLNGNFVRGDGEEGRAGLSVYLDLNNDGVLSAHEPTVVTDAAGTYAFEDLTPGSYHVRLAVPAGERRTLGHLGFAVQLAEGQTAVRDFGVTKRALVSGIVFEDADRNRQRGPAEIGLVGVRVYLDANNNGQYDVGENFVLTNAAGNYFLSAPASGSYRIRVVVPNGQTQTQPAAGPHLVTGESGASLYGRNFGVAPALGGRIQGTVFSDTNGNFVRDDGEAGYPAQVVYIDLNQNGVLDPGEPLTMTDANGAYAFEEVVAEKYTLRVLAPAGHRLTLGNRGYELGMMAKGGIERNFGLTQRALVSGIIYTDANVNSRRDPEESGVAGVRVYLDANNNGQYDEGENFVFSNAAGNYFLSAPATGDYWIRAVAPEGRAQTQPLSRAHLVTGTAGASLYGYNMGFAPFGMAGHPFNDAPWDFFPEEESEVLRGVLGQVI